MLNLKSQWTKLRQEKFYQKTLFKIKNGQLMFSIKVTVGPNDVNDYLKT